MTDFLPKVNIKPTLVQNEIHPYYQEKEVVKFMHENGIAIEGWYPLGGRGYTAAMLGNETIGQIAKSAWKISCTNNFEMGFAKWHSHHSRFE